MIQHKKQKTIKLEIIQNENKKIFNLSKFCEQKLISESV